MVSVCVCMVILTQMLIGDLTARSVLMCDARSVSSVLVLGGFTLSPYIESKVLCQASTKNFPNQTLKLII